MFRVVFCATLLAASAGVSAETLYDPTQPPVGAAPAPVVETVTDTRLQLSFIINRGAERRARINGQWVTEGDRIAGAEVLRIEAAQVRLRRGGKLLVLPLANSGSVQKHYRDSQR